MKIFPTIGVPKKFRRIQLKPFLAYTAITLTLITIWCESLSYGQSDQVEYGEISYNRIIEDITVEKAYKLIQENEENPDFVILDIRTPEEFARGHIKNAVNWVDYYSETFREDLDGLNKTKTYLIYCRTGGRSGITLTIMDDLGFSEVYNMLGGITAWKQQGFQVVTTGVGADNANDNDRDGLPDDWERRYFGDLSQGAGGDFDGDGVSNVEEYQVGTNPSSMAVGDVAPLGDRDGTVNVGDALVALRFALTLETPTAEDIAHGDVAPLDAQNKPNPDGVINVGDALVILRKALEIISF